MEHICFNCGQKLKRIISCRDECYICEKCETIWFVQTIRIICPDCKCHYQTQKELVTFEQYQAQKVIEEWIVCALCYLIRGNDE